VSLPTAPLSNDNVPILLQLIGTPLLGDGVLCLWGAMPLRI
jgi:hypothetical protein